MTNDVLIKTTLCEAFAQRETHLRGLMILEINSLDFYKEILDAAKQGLPGLMLFNHNFGRLPLTIKTNYGTWWTHV